MSGNGEPCHHVDGKIFCKDDFILSGHSRTLKKCHGCSSPITGRCLQALSEFYHPYCFKCSICYKGLEADPFTINPTNKVMCLEDFHKLYSPKCAKCQDTIFPIENTGILVRVKASNRDFHLDCFCCEVCGERLGGEEDGAYCYPLSGIFMCKKCHVDCINDEEKNREMRRK